MGGSDDGKNVRASIDISTDFRVKRFFPLLGKQASKTESLFSKKIGFSDEECIH
jgi:hypothetical protein